MPANKISPRVVARILHPIFESSMIRIRDPLRLLCPKGRSGPAITLGRQSHQNQLRPGLYHGLPIRERPSLFIQAGRVHKLVNENTTRLLLSIYKDAIRAAGRCVASIHMLRPHFLTHIWKAAHSLRCEPHYTPRFTM